MDRTLDARPLAFCGIIKAMISRDLNGIKLLNTEYAIISPGLTRLASTFKDKIDDSDFAG